MEDWESYERRKNLEQQERVFNARKTLANLVKDFPSEFINGSEVKLIEVTCRNIVKLVKLKALGVISLRYENHTKDTSFSDTSLIELETLVASGEIENFITITKVEINKWFSKLPVEIPVEIGDYILIDPHYDESYTDYEDFRYVDTIPLVMKLDCIQANRYFKVLDREDEELNKNKQNKIEPFSWLD